MKDPATIVPGGCDSPRAIDAGAWVRRAVCRQLPAGLGRMHGPRTDLARAVCSACPVREACLWSAMADEVGAEWRFGVRGGRSPGQRARLAGRVGGAPEAVRRFWRDMATGAVA